MFKRPELTYTSCFKRHWHTSLQMNNPRANSRLKSGAIRPTHYPTTTVLLGAPNAFRTPSVCQSHCCCQTGGFLCHQGDLVKTSSCRSLLTSTNLQTYNNPSLGVKSPNIISSNPLQSVTSFPKNPRFCGLEDRICSVGQIMCHDLSLHQCWKGVQCNKEKSIELFEVSSTVLSSNTHLTII